MSSSLRSVEVIIVGAGPTGLALANLLGLYGVEALILERNSEPCAEPRAISLDDEGARVCQAMGLWREIAPHLLENPEIYYYSGHRLLSRVMPTARPYGFPLFSTFHQPTFEKVLRDGLLRFPMITLQFGVHVETFCHAEDHVLVSVRGPGEERQQIRCAYLLACDGAKSTIRHILQVPMQGATYAQRWLVLDSLDDSDTSPAIRFFCNPARPAVTVPAPGQRRRWECMLLPGESEEWFTRPENIHALIRQVSPSAQPQITRATVYTFHAALARTFQVERVFLLGDAAHLMPPFGGQGMNCGLRDAQNLAWKLRLVLRKQAHPTLLTSYTPERRAHARRLIRFSRLLGAIIMPTARPIAWLRDGFFSTLNAIPPVRAYLSQAAIKPQPRYKQGFFLRGGSGVNRRLAGRMLPQPEIINRDREGTREPLDDLLGNGFALLHLNAPQGQPFANLAAASPWQQLGVRLLAVSDELREVVGTRKELFVLVRPDRYIYAVVPPQEVDYLARTWAKSLDNVS